MRKRFEADVKPGLPVNRPRRHHRLWRGRRRQEELRMSRQDPARMGAVDAARLVREGGLSALDLTEACLARIRAREDEVRAWTYLDADHARRQARERDEHKGTGAALGPLHGVPVALKDI